MVSLTREMKEKIDELSGTTGWNLVKIPAVDREGELFSVKYHGTPILIIEVFQDRTLQQVEEAANPASR